MLSHTPFAGRVLGQFQQACNLVDAAGWVIALTLPAVGNGPFSIVVEGRPGLFDGLAVNQPARLDARQVLIGNWRLDLEPAKVWEAQLPVATAPLVLFPTIAAVLSPYTEWPRPTESLSAAAKQLSRIAQAGARQLSLALREYTEPPKVVVETMLDQAVGQLAGLGSGLTPAGDDYLVGVMAALWLLGYHALPPQIAAIAMPKTTTLSAAFLSAAGQGQFIEPWHMLIDALYEGNEYGLTQAVQRVAQFGASSGLDGLAGFSTIFLNLVGKK